MFLQNTHVSLSAGAIHLKDTLSAGVRFIFAGESNKLWTNNAYILYSYYLVRPVDTWRYVFAILTTGFYVVKSGFMWLKVVECGFM